jgi:maltose alpha-D-glucosyltransferase/alpha-amylase
MTVSFGGGKQSMDSAPWYKNAVFYQVYLRAFKDSNGDGFGDLKGLTQELDYLQELGVDCIWLMPISPSPLKDDGYDIADYYTVADMYGNLDDFQELLDAAHDRNMRLIMDLVMNHTSNQHPWFESARRHRRSPFRDYYEWSDTDQLYKEARVIFVDVESSNWAWDQSAKQFYWHRFYSSQPDLNYDNPKVQEEMLNVARFWLAFGVDGLRADAVPYLFEKEGTSCENLPETHEYLKRLRAEIKRDFPGSMLLCEANQPAEDVRAYFGDGNEFHMAFHFPLMPRMYMAIGKGRVDDLRAILDRTPPIPADCQWCTFLRNHDELTLEMVSEEDRQWMWEHFAPEARMRLNLGIRRRLAPLLNNDRRQILLMNSLLFTLPGAPIIYYGDEIGMGDNIWLPDRNGLRTPMQWNTDLNAGFSEAPAERLFAQVIGDDVYGPNRVNVRDQRNDAGSLWHTLHKMLAVRKANSVFGSGTLEWLDLENHSVAAFRRRQDSSEVLCLHNLSDSAQTITIRQDAPSRDLLSGETVTADKMAQGIELWPYQYMWLSDDGIAESAA